MDTDCKCVECLGTLIAGERTDYENELNESHDNQENNHVNELPLENVQLEPPERTPDYVPSWYTDEEESESEPEDNTEQNGNNQSGAEIPEPAEREQFELREDQVQVGREQLELNTENNNEQTNHNAEIVQNHEQLEEESDDSQQFVPRRTSRSVLKRKYQETAFSSESEYEPSDDSSDEGETSDSESDDSEQDNASSDSEAEQQQLKRGKSVQKGKVLKERIKDFPVEKSDVEAKVITINLNCPIEGCNQKPKDKTALTQHMKTIHKNQTSPCLVRGCGRSFTKM